MNQITSLIAGIIGFFIASFLLSYPGMLLWNYCLVDAISGVHSVTWLQMWGISFLVRCVLFKSN